MPSLSLLQALATRRLHVTFCCILPLILGVSLVKQTQYLTRFPSFSSPKEESSSSSEFEIAVAVRTTCPAAPTETITPCGPCDDDQQFSCARIWQQHPNLPADCVVHPENPECTLRCADFYHHDAFARDDDPTSSNSSGNSSSSSSSSCDPPSLWPPLRPDAGCWVEDPEYCAGAVGTTRECIMNNTRRWNINTMTTTTSAPCSKATSGTNDKHQNYMEDDLSFWRPTDADTACAMLRARNVTDIMLTGDSIMRHLWQAVVMVLTGNPNYDFVHKGASCLGNNVFLENTCQLRTFFKNIVTTAVCSVEDNATTYPIQVHFHAAQELPTAMISDPNRGRTIHYYGVGLHPPDRLYDNIHRLGILNSTAWRRIRWQDLDGQQDLWGDGAIHSFVWVPPHFRISIGRADETNARGYRFLRETHQIFQEHRATSTLNTFSMTAAVAPFFCRYCTNPNNVGKIADQCNHCIREKVCGVNATPSATQSTTGNSSSCNSSVDDTTPPAQETLDGVHYGRSINLWKAHLALRHYEQLVKPTAVNMADGANAI